jgi:hypothetical protein
LLCFVAAAAGVLAEAGADASVEDALARALEANRRWEQFAAELRAENEQLQAENARLRAAAARRDAELEQVKAALAVLQRMVFGRSSEQARPAAAGRGDGSGRAGDGPARWWLWVFVGPDTACLVMDPTRAGAVLARQAGIDEKTGQLTGSPDGGPRQLVVSSDFYAVYTAAGKKADGLVDLFC